MSGGLKAFTDLNATVLGVSVDSPFAQEAWAAKEKIELTLCSDLNKETATAYDVLLQDLAGIGSHPHGLPSSSIRTASSNTASRLRLRRISRTSKR